MELRCTNICRTILMNLLVWIFKWDSLKVRKTLSDLLKKAKYAFKYHQVFSFLRVYFKSCGRWGGVTRFNHSLDKLHVVSSSLTLRDAAIFLLYVTAISDIVLMFHEASTNSPIAPSADELICVMIQLICVKNQQLYTENLFEQAQCYETLFFFRQMSCCWQCFCFLH